MDLVQDLAFVGLYDFKTRDKWIKRPPGSYVCKLIWFIRLQMAIQGRSVATPVFKGGSKKLGEAMSRVLQETEFRDLRWHCWRRAGATVFARARASMPKLMAFNMCGPQVRGLVGYNSLDSGSGTVATRRSGGTYAMEV